jgi:hypothetical protein
MADLACRQQQLWQLLCSFSEKPPMLRVSRTDDCLWVCDLPRRTGGLEAAAERLETEGFAVWLDETDRLWHIDLPLTDRLFCNRPTPIPLPQKAELHPLYSLYRLLLSHPSQEPEQPMPLVRALLKLTLLAQEERKHSTEKLHSLCAQRLNRRQPLPYAAAAVLMQTIQKEEQL